jgi:uncharacterized membrane protein YhhN
MNAATFLLVALAAVVAVADWIAVAAGARIAEYVLKPLTMVVLILAALELDPSSDAARGALVVGLVLSLVGDVLLMVPADLFVPGLAAFLAAHVAYVVALWMLGVSGAGLLVGIAVVVVGALIVGRRILAGAAASDKALVAPVTAYLAVISAMVVSALGVGAFFAVSGALLFYASDAVLGWTRFVSDFPRSRVVVMVTYHLGQLGLVLALI